MKSHIFITTKHLDRCLETGLFGVTPGQINHLANVAEGDTIFLLETQSNRIVGPFTITNPLFYNQLPIWKESQDSFVYRVKFTSTEIWESDVSSLWAVLLQRGTQDFYTFTTFQRSNNTLFPEEGTELTNLLKRQGRLISAKLASNIMVEKADLIKSDAKAFSSEARLEAALLINQEVLIEALTAEGILNSGTKPFVINQITLPGINYNVDIAVFDGEQVVVIELKKDKIDDQTIAQVKRYSHYWELVGKNVALVVIGTKFGRSVEKNNEVTRFRYAIDRRNFRVSLKSDAREYYIPV